MNLLLRWGKFNLVGAVGMAVQLAALAALARAFPAHDLLATAAAIEITLLHNFVGHLHLTWRDRRQAPPLFSRLLRFHLANGLVSLTGNLSLTPLLCRQARLPLLVANTVAILGCSALNFLLGDRWAFATSPIPGR